MADRSRSSDRDEEEEFFKREDVEKKAKIRRERQLTALRQEERESIASKLNTSEDVAEEAMKLGFDGETARVLPLVPLIQVAWADGKVTTAQADKVKTKAAKFGVLSETPAYDFLDLLLSEQPTDIFFERVNDVIRRIVDEEPSTEIRSNVLEWSHAVAEASGGFFGLTNPISKRERKVLEELGDVVGLE